MRDARPRVGVSACLLGEPVRFDGNHKRDSFLVDVLGPQVQWVPVCPEMEAGFGTPREPMRLTLLQPESRPACARFNPRNLALVVIRTGDDVTRQLVQAARKRVEWLAGQRLSGFVLKKDSPSCGVERVKVFDARGVADRGGRGLFAEALMARLPNLPVEEEGRLSYPRVRANFIERIFAYHRVRHLFSRHWTAGDLARFHSANKGLLLAHSPSGFRALSRLVAGARNRPKRFVAAEYESGFMRILTVVAARSRQPRARSMRAAPPQSRRLARRVAER
jgi:uncharacterized protein YbbK (DUF523 family)